MSLAVDRKLADQKLADLSERLLEVLGAAIGPWVLQQVMMRVPAAERGAGSPALVAAENAANEATAALVPRLEALLRADIDDQRGNPLGILRDAVGFVTAVLRDASIAAVDRDAQARSLHPDDAYDVTPGAFADFGVAAQQAGLEWGAAKAFVHLRRHATDRAPD
jgi:hypothetical protein